jgi:hypothetical protein
MQHDLEAETKAAFVRNSVEAVESGMLESTNNININSKMAQDSCAY